MPSHNRSAIRSQTVRTRGLGPITVSRWPKIGRVDCRRQRVSKHLSDRIPKVSKTARAVAPSLSRHARRLCAAAGTAPSPFLDSRESAASTARAIVCRCKHLLPNAQGRNPKVRQTACPVAPSLSATLANRVPARASAADPAHRWSKIGRVARPHQYACNDRGGRNPKVRQTACAVAPSLSDTSPDHAPARASTADPVHRWSKIGRVARPHQYACKTRGGRNPKVRQTAFVCHWQLSLRLLLSSG